MTFDEVAKDWRSYTLVERLLEQIITRAIDMNRHMIAELGEGTERTFKHEETFLELANLDVIDEKLAKQTAPSAGLRNRLVHDYNDTDPRIIYNSIGEALEDYSHYCEAILQFIEKQPE